MMKLPIQQLLETERLRLIPLAEEDFTELFELASDPLVWEQHPNKNRYQPEEFRNYFKGAMESLGAYKIVEKDTAIVIGCTRYYDFNEADNSIFIGYTFLGRQFWKQGYNQEIKSVMVQHAFTFANAVVFHIGTTNYRSQSSIEKFGAVRTGEIEIAYYGEETKKNFIYEIKNPIQRMK